MKILFLSIAVCLLAAACATGPKTAAPEEIYADVLVNRDVLPPVLEITFYSKTRQDSNRMEYTKNILAVEEPKLNAESLVLDTEKPGSTAYKATTRGVVPTNTISAKVNGKQFEGKSAIELMQSNKMVTVTMLPK